MSGWLTNENVSNKLKQTYVLGFMDISGNCVVRNGTLNVNTNCFVGNTLTVENQITCNRDLYISGNTILNSNLRVGNKLTCDGPVLINGIFSITGRLLVKQDNLYMLEIGNISQSSYTLTSPYYQTYNITTTGPTNITLPSDISALNGIEITFVKTGSISDSSPVNIYTPNGTGNNIVLYSSIVPTNVYSMATIKTTVKFVVVNNRWYESVYTPPTEIIDATFRNITATGNIYSNLFVGGNIDAHSMGIDIVDASYITTRGLQALSIVSIGNINASSVIATGDIRSTTITADEIRTTTLSVSSFGDIVARSLTANTISVGETFIVPSIVTPGNITAQSFYATSDQRLKTDVRLLPSQWENIKSLKPSEYIWKKDSTYDCGFIAQQIYQIYPHLKPLIDADMNAENPVNANGEPIYYTIDYSKLTPLLCKGLQEVMVETEQLREEIRALKRNLPYFYTEPIGKTPL